MFKVLLIAFTLALAAFSHQPITELPAGNYLGEGNLVSTLGSEYTYASYASISSDRLNFTIVRDGDLFSYDIHFAFDDNGFFTVRATEDTGEDIVIHDGYGYCQSVQCHFDIETDTRKIEETLTFKSWEGKLYTIGSMRYVDENGDEQALAWEEQYFLISDNDDGDGDSAGN